MTMADDPMPEGPGEGGSGRPGAGSAASGGTGSGGAAPGGGAPAGPAPGVPAHGASAADGVPPERELRKGDDESRVFAGVCAGLGRYTGTDPVVWRAAFALTAFAMATGLLLYIAAWMLMRDARGGPATFEQMLNRSIPPRTVPKLLAVGLGFATVWSLVGGLGWSTLVLAVPLVLGLLVARNRGVDLRAAFVRLREDLRSSEPPPMTPSPEPAPAYYNPAQPWASAPRGPVDLAVVSERAAGRASRAAGRDWSDEDEEDAGKGRGSGPCAGRGLPLASLALWTIVAGAVVTALGAYGWSSSLWSARTASLLFGPETGVLFLSGALAVVGVYALAGTRVGNPRGLMFLGLVTALVLTLASVTDLTRVRVGEQTWRPATVAAAEANEHRLTLGSGTVDLTGLEDLVSGGTVDVSVRVAVGHTQLLLPEGARVVVDSRVGLGAVDPGSGREDAVGYSMSHEEVYEPAGEDAADPPVINVRTDALFGIVEVRHGEA